MVGLDKRGIHFEDHIITSDEKDQLPVEQVFFFPGFVFFFWGGILPVMAGILVSHHANPYSPSNIPECNKSFYAHLKDRTR